MIIEKNKFFFKTVSIVLEDDKILPSLDSGKYSSIVAVSYNKLDLPKFESYSKPTLLIDLKKSEDEIFASFNDTTRNEIRKTFKDEQLRLFIEEAPSKETYQVYKEFEYSQGRVPVNMSLLSDVMFFGIMLDNKVISGLYVNKSTPYLRVRSIFSKRLKTEDKEIYKLIAYSTRRSVWEACVWGKKQGYVSLDMASVNINNPKTESIARFKMSFGKELVPEYIYIYKSSAFAFFEKAAKVKIASKRLIFALKKFIS